MKNLQMSFEQFEEANKLFDKLLNEIDEFSEIENILNNELNNLDKSIHYDFLRHISTLFLNVFLNGYRYGENGKKKSTHVRKFIYDKIVDEDLF